MASDFDFEGYADSSDVDGIDFEKYGEPTPTTKPNSMADESDVGPPSDGLSNRQLNPTHSSRAEAVLSGIQEAIPGSRQAGAGLQVISDKITGQKSTYDAYRKMQDEKRAAALQEHPAYFAAGNLPASVATAFLGGAAIPAKASAQAPVVARFAQSLIPTHATTISNGGDINDTAQNMLLGESIGTGANAVGGAFKSGYRKVVGEGLQKPQQLTDDMFKWIGGTKVGKWLGEGAKDVGTSAKVSSLKNDIEAANAFQPKAVENSGGGLSSKFAKSSMNGETELGLDGSFTTRSPEMVEDVAKSVRDVGDELVSKYTPGYNGFESLTVEQSNRAPLLRKQVGENMRAGRSKAAAEEVLNSDKADMNATAANTPAARRKVEAKKEATKRELESLSPDDSAFATMGVKFKPSQKPISRPSEPFNADRGFIEDGPLKRDFGTHEQRVERFGDRQDPDWWDSAFKKNSSGDVRGDKLRDEFFSKHSHESNPTYFKETKRPKDSLSDLASLAEARRLEDGVYAIKKKYPEAVKKEISSSVDRARSSIEDDISNKWNLDKKASDAESELEKIARGRQAAQKITAGSSAGVGLARAGIVGGVAGHLAGGEGFKKVMSTVDVAGKYGQKLAKTMSSLEELSKKDDSMGRAAKWAMQAKDEQGLIARVAAIAKLRESEQSGK